MGELRDKDVIKTKPLTVSSLFALPKELDEGRLVGFGNEGDESSTDNETEAIEQRNPGNTSDDMDEEASSGSGGTSWSGSNRPSDDPLLGGTIWFTPPFVPPLDPQPMHPPREIKVKSQTPRFNPDGTYVVDVILEFSDIPGAQSYEVRLAT